MVIGCVLRAADIFTSPVAMSTLRILALQTLNLWEQASFVRRHDVISVNRLRQVAEAFSEASAKREALSDFGIKIEQMLGCSARCPLEEF